MVQRGQRKKKKEEKKKEKRMRKARDECLHFRNS